MKAVAALALALGLLATTAFAQTCGPYNCYLAQGCNGAPVPVDFVFAIDTSGSMQNAINGVVQGVNSFAKIATQANNQFHVDAYFTLVLFSQPDTDPTLKVQNTNNAATFLNQVNKLTPNSLTGWRETGLETMRCIANACVVDNMNIAFRTGAKKALLFFTDEDSDPANHAQNSYQSVTENDMWCAPYAITGQPLPSDNDGSQIPTYISATKWTNEWQAEITATANVLIQQDWSLYLLNNNHDNTYLTCLNFVQYGNPNLAVQNTDYTGWNAAATLANLRASYSGNSVQALMLAANKVAKTFYVYNAAQTSFVNNFLQGITNDVNQCNSCLFYPCQGTQCLAPVPSCDCAGTPLPGAYPNFGNPLNVKDKNGACCLASAIDCNGICNGGGQFDTKCGVCTAGGVTPSNCVPDCTGTYYLQSAPLNGATVKPLPALASPAGYLVAQGNGDLLSYGASHAWQAADVQNQFQTQGRYQGRYTCTFDYAYFLSANAALSGQCSSQSTCETLFFTDLALVSAGTLKARCQAGTLVKISPQAIDLCGQCVANPNSPPQCVSACSPVGCSGVARQGFTTCTTSYYNQTIANPPSLDSCGICQLGGVTPASEKDSCGVCFGNNSEKDPCGNCPGAPGFNLGKDACGQNLCNPNKPACNIMCNNQTSNVVPSPFGLDKCGDCVAYDSGSGTYPNAAGCAQQCDGTWRNPNSLPFQASQPPAKVYDNCGYCILAGQPDPNKCVQDCAGTWNGLAHYDQCGQCVGGNSPNNVPCLQDCAGTYYLTNSQPLHIKNSCGVCVLATGPDATNVVTCGVCTHSDANSVGALYDKCGNCNNQPSYNSTWCLQDCAGGWYNNTNPPSPHAVYDLCGNCITPANMSMFNWNRDQCGTCWPGGSADPRFNSAVTIDPFFNRTCGCNVPLRFCAFYNASICSDCPPFCPPPNTVDSCQRCSNTPFYNMYDQCGQCCNDAATCSAAPGKDLCGTCFGPIISQTILNNQPCGMCPPGTPGYKPFTIDCAGVCNGPHSYDCRGQCGINSTVGFCTVCSASGQCQQICGNGILEGTEQCDDGLSNGMDGICTASCTLVPQSNTGAIVGGVVGGLAALLALAAVAAFLIHYARQHGLMGFGNKSVDMGGANMNPMYKQQTTIATNPLYQNV